jgi:uncharacterized protein (DUF952 family)
MYIYHIVQKDLFISSLEGFLYRPSSLLKDGFIHCSLESSVIPVANDYYADENSPLLLLLIDTEKMVAETQYEEAAAPEGVGTSHKNSACVFPHVYGPIEINAMVGIGLLRKANNKYCWPEEFISTQEFLYK